MIALLRRFLVLHALLIWQGGFVFYAGVVVPIGTEVFGSFEQGRVTREVTHVLNHIGVVALALFAWDHLAERRRWSWLWWGLMAGGLVGLWWLHPRIERQIDFDSGTILDYGTFYFWHRVYLYTASVTWLASMVASVQFIRRDR